MSPWSHCREEAHAPNGRSETDAALTPLDITVAIPTFQREGVLISTLTALLEQQPAEVLVVDQTDRHDPATARALQEWNATKRIRWIRLARPSITRAMNTGLAAASCALVLFVDDDIVPDGSLLISHASGFRDQAVWAVAGQVLQPGDEPDSGPVDLSERLGASLKFRFNSALPATIRSGMAGNLSVRRDQALALGGFDENFAGVAYRFETEFCRRLCEAGGRIQYEPTASIRHLKHPSGGTRAHGSHLTSASPAHGVGDYYFALRFGMCLETLNYISRRPFREIATRFHLRHPWWIPVKCIGEMGALAWAVGLLLRGPRFVQRPSGQC